MAIPKVDLRGLDPSSPGWASARAAICMPLFSSDTVISFVSNLLKLEHTVEKMTLDGLGVQEENIAAHRHTLTYSLRLSHYGVPEESKMGVTLPRHTDPSFTTAIVQHEVEGLEV
ncbi:Gibberellin 3-beta-dioxygenase 1 [Panicum miliaceum]|uniref:Gibberellin 3-beta-dioxygenase 1 n=1 Tax=Panicum miliaceum TaxID=4540 RepID=A0A3L6S3U5_PANMI|nr:Gibberellin 3-beta-dioxygenase 1 [Panicum miliaceum]